VYRKSVVPISLGLFAALTVYIFSGMPPLNRLEYLSYDWRVALRNHPVFSFLQAKTHTRNPSIAVIPIDEESIEKIKEPMVFWIPHFAAVIGNIIEGGARVVALDYQFKVSPEEHLQRSIAGILNEMAGERDLSVESITPLLQGDDMKLFNVLRSGRVVLMSFLKEDGTVERGYPRFAWGAGLKNLGLVNMEPDEDGVVRRQFLYKTTGTGTSEEVLFSFDLITFCRSMDASVELDRARGLLRIGNALIRHDQRYRIPINWVGPPGTFRSHYSFVDLLERAGDGDTAFFRSEFSGKTVLIGPSYTGVDSSDIVRTPYHVAENLEMYGVEVHANTVNTLLNGDYILPMPRWVTPVVLVVIGLLMALLCSVYRPVIAVPAGLAVALAMIACSFVMLYRYNRWMYLAGTLVCIPLTFALVYTFRYLSEERQRKHIRALLGRYISEVVAESILRDPSNLDLGGTRADVSILFCDINDFTPMSERSQPEEIISTLNEYFTLMERAIFRHGATLKQFVGDEIMVICGAPRPVSDHPAMACRLALDMVRQLRKWQAERKAAGLDAFQVKFGLHCGEVVVGNVGSPHRTEYAAVGDVVNTAARIMSLSKKAGKLLLISEAMHDRIGDGFETRLAGRFPVKGKSGELNVYELIKEKSIDADDESSHA